MRLSPFGALIRVRNATIRLVVVAASAVAFSGPAVAHAQEAITLNEVLDLRRRGVPSRQILRAAQEFCVAFTVNDAVERALVAVGADTVLITGIRQSCVATSPSVQLAAGVLVDDAFTAMSGLRTFTATDGLCTARPHTRGLRVENRRSAYGCAIEYPVDLGGANVRIELTVVTVDGKRDAMAALGFGKDVHSWDQYSFAITSDDRFELCVSSGGRCQRLLFQKRRAVAGDSLATRMAVEIRGRQLSLHLDDAQVASYTAMQDIVGGISLGVGARSSAVFSRLRVERLQGLATSR